MGREFSATTQRAFAILAGSVIAGVVITVAMLVAMPYTGYRVETKKELQRLTFVFAAQEGAIAAMNEEWRDCPDTKCLAEKLYEEAVADGLMK
jgi:hypothetical protein